ncbi:UNVERIFIED_CONTAM: Transcription factor [Sesamum radiatum]|uniref:Transcription factor n=1 Tax=Sesamum radiatum TaxID=300843 RepID=A0AAW2RD02_SESRA
MDSFDEELAAVLAQDFGTCLSTGKHFSSSPTLINIIPSITFLETPSEPPPKLQKPYNFSNFSTIQGLPNPARASSTPIILNFGSANPREENPRHSSPDEEAYNIVSEILRSEEQTECAQNLKKPSRIRQPSQTYDHIIAERKRREQLSQMFVALSTIVPGLKKTDKTSVLGDAIKYLKYLQERVKTLEEKAAKKTMESVVLVKKSQILDEKLRKVESLNLTVVNTNAVSFGNLAFDITIITEMEKEFNLTVNEVVKALHAALQHAS